jgi:hypothetical protein
VEIETRQLRWKSCGSWSWLADERRAWWYLVPVEADMERGLWDSSMVLPVGGEAKRRRRL